MHDRLSPAAANRRGIAAMSLAMASFVTNDALVKYVSQTLPTAQLIFIRAVFAALLLLVVARAMGALNGAGLRAMAQRRVLLRSGLDALGTFTYLTSLFHLPIGNATAINMATPLFITLFAVIAFRERVGAGRWLAVAVGLCRRAADRAAQRGGLQRLCAAVPGGHVVPCRARPGHAHHRAQHAVHPDHAGHSPGRAGHGRGADRAAGLADTHRTQLLLLAAAAVFLSAGYYLVITGMRAGEMSVIAPFRYTGLLFALVLGWLVWGDVPNLLAFCGIALLVAAGLTMVRTERARQRAAALDAASD
jgi:drug/metabolite transporter (DMT)-like permease